MAAGILWGLGVGPGDPELITLKAARLIREADLVAYPAPDEGDSLARAIAAPHIPDGKQEYAIRIPMVVARHPAQEVYDQAALDLAQELEAGKNIAVLCEGDPFLYGSFMYLCGRLADRFDVRVVPGVSSVMASAAAIGAPLAARNDILTVLPGPLPVATLKAHLEQTDAALIIKVGRHFVKLRELISDMGLEDKAWYVERATFEHQKVMPLVDVTADSAPYFSTILVHKRGMAWS